MFASTCVSFFTWWISLIILFGCLENGKKRKEIQSLRSYLAWLLFYLFLVGFDCINRHKFMIFYVKFNNKILCIWTHSSTSSCHTWNSIIHEILSHILDFMYLNETLAVQIYIFEVWDYHWFYENLRWKPKRILTFFWSSGKPLHLWVVCN